MSDSPDDVDPKDFLRALLKISPEDAEKVRDETPDARKDKQQQDVPTGDDR